MKAFIIQVMCGILLLCSADLVAQDYSYPNGFPEKGKMTLEKKYPKATTINAQKQMFGKGVKGYGVEVVQGTEHFEIDMNQEGTITEVVRIHELLLADAPDVCVKAVREKTRGMKIAKVEKLQSESKLTYRFSGPAKNATPGEETSTSATQFVHTDAHGNVLENYVRYSEFVDCKK